MSQFKIVILIGLLFFSLCQPCLAYNIEGDRVWIDDQNINLTIIPHTVPATQEIDLYFISKVYTGDADLLIGFSDERVKITGARLEQPHWVNTTRDRSLYLHNVTEIVVTDDPVEIGYEYNTYKRRVTYYNPVYPFTGGYEQVTRIIGFDSYEQSDDDYTVTFNEQVSEFKEYKDITSFLQSHINYNFDGKGRWYPLTDLPVIQGVQYHLKLMIDVPISQIPVDTKYDIALKPSGETIAQAIGNNHFYYIDPWVNASFGKKKQIYIDNTGGTAQDYFPIRLNVTYDSDMQNDFGDLRVYNETSNTSIPFWVEKQVDGVYCDILFNASHIHATNSTDYYLYYDNGDASNVSDGFTTFPFFDDFTDGDYTTGVAWELLPATQTWSASGGVLKAGTSDEAAHTIFTTNNISFPTSFYFNYTIEGIAVSSPDTIVHLATAKDKQDPQGYKLLQQNSELRLIREDDTADTVIRDDTPNIGRTNYATYTGWSKNSTGAWSIHINNKADGGTYNRFLDNSNPYVTDTTYTSTSLNHIKVYTHRQNTWIDNLYIRSYMDTGTQPHTTLGSEEELPTTEECTNVSISSLTNNTANATYVTITWSTNASADNIVKYSNQSDLSNPSWSSWDNATTSPVIEVNNLVHDTKYYYQAWSYNATNESCVTTDPSSTPYKNFTTPSIGWSNDSFGKKRLIHIDNTGGTAQDHFPIRLNVTYDSDMQNDFKDLRIYNETSGLSVPFWVEKQINGSYCDILFNASHIHATNMSDYYLYYNNSSAGNVSDGFSTFLFFDDFTDGDWNNSVQWEILSGTQTWSAAGGVLKAGLNDNNAHTIFTSDTISFPTSFYFNYTVETLGVNPPDTIVHLTTTKDKQDPPGYKLRQTNNDLDLKREDDTLDTLMIVDTVSLITMTNYATYTGWSKNASGRWTVYINNKAEGGTYDRYINLTDPYATDTTYNSAALNYIKVYTHRQNTWLDNFYIRPYMDTDTQPHTTIGVEQDKPTDEDCTPVSISSLTNSTANETDVTITWSTNTSADNIVKYSNQSDLSSPSWSTWDNTTTSPVIVINGLTCNTTYYYQAWAYNSTNESCVTTNPVSSPYKNFTTADCSSNVTINVCAVDVGSVLLHNNTTATIRQFTPDYMNFTIKANNTSITNYVIYIENTDPDLVKAYGTDITQESFSNYTIKLTTNLTTAEKWINMTRLWYPSNWSLIAMGDSRIGYWDNNTDLVADHFTLCVLEASQINSVHPVILSGDNVGGGGSFTDGTIATNAKYNAQWANGTKDYGIYVAVVGNHDMARGAEPQYTTENRFIYHYGALEYNYTYGDWYVIMVDSYRDDGTAPSQPQGYLKEPYISNFEDEIANHKAEYNLIASFHHPLYRYQDGAGGSAGDWYSDNAAVRALVDEGNITLNLVGHDHHHWVSTESGGMIQVIEGRAGADLHGGATQYGFSIVRMNQTGVRGVMKFCIEQNMTHDANITTTYEGNNNYTNTDESITIVNDHNITLPTTVKLRLSDTNVSEYIVSGFEYYEIVENDYGYVLIGEINATEFSTTNASVTGTADTSFTVTLPGGYSYAKFEPSNSTHKNCTPNGQTDSISFYNVTNTGNVPLDIRMRLNATVTNIDLKADTDNNPSGSTIITTSLQTIYSNLAIDNNVDFWIWTDLNRPPPQSTNKSLEINVTQS